jgi:hypothetical protein
MFNREKCILGQELAEVGNMNVANISMMIQDMSKGGNSSDVTQFGNCNYINVTSPDIPLYILKHVHKCTNVQNMLPMTYLTKEFSTSKQSILKSLSQYIVKVHKIANKELVEFNTEFVEKFDGKVHYILNSKETNECLRDGYIDGFIYLDKNRYLVWY